MTDLTPKQVREILESLEHAAWIAGEESERSIYALCESWLAMHERLGRAEALLREWSASGVEHEDARMDYCTVQVSTDLRDETAVYFGETQPKEATDD